MNRLQALQDAGVSIWVDTLSRELLDSGDFAALIADSAVTGATSNPSKGRIKPSWPERSSPEIESNPSQVAEPPSPTARHSASQDVFRPSAHQLPR